MRFFLYSSFFLVSIFRHFMWFNSWYLWFEFINKLFVIEMHLSFIVHFSGILFEFIFLCWHVRNIELFDLSLTLCDMVQSHTKLSLYLSARYAEDSTRAILCLRTTYQCWELFEQFARDSSLSIRTMLFSWTMRGLFNRTGKNSIQIKSDEWVRDEK